MMQAKSLRAGLRQAAVVATGMLLALVASTPAYAQLFGREIAQPFFDFPVWGRFDTCRPQPLAWGFDPYAHYGPCDPGGCGDCNNCDNSCPQPPAPWVAHRPNNWYVTADFAPLLYDPNHDVEIARLGALGPTQLSTADLDNNYDSGGKFTIGKVLNTHYRLEGSYQTFYSYGDNIAITDNTLNGLGGLGNLSTLLSEFSVPPTVGLDQNNFVAIDNFSTMRTAEINLRYWVDMPPGPFDVSWLIGGRYFQMNEQFNFLSQSANPGLAVTNDVAVGTRNELYGLQLGIEMAYMVHPRYWFNIDLKCALCNNHVSQATEYNVTTNGALATFNTGAAQDRTALLGDISVIGCWQMTPSIVFRMGYQAMFVNGLALGMDNLQTDNTLLVNGPGQLDDAGEVVYHGPVIGLTWAR